MDLLPLTATMTRAIMSMLRPHRLVGAEKVRVGRIFDGGYIMADCFDGIEAAYSLGINDDVSWDYEIASRGIPVFQYDHTIAGPPEQHPLFHWEPKCISGVADPNNNIESLTSLLSRNGHGDSTDLLLKCDIEGSEWNLLQLTPNTSLTKFRQIVIEVHKFEMLSDPIHAENMRRSITNLTMSHRVVHVHANNFGGWIVVGGIPLPNVLEFTLVRKDVGEFVVSDETFPTPMDMPCHAFEADLYLGRFAFD